MIYRSPSLRVSESDVYYKALRLYGIKALKTGVHIFPADLADYRR